MDADTLKHAFKLATGAAKQYSHGLEYHADHFNMAAKVLLSKSAPKLKVIFKF